jgi:hypothetical protein
MNRITEAEAKQNRPRSVSLRFLPTKYSFQFRRFAASAIADPVDLAEELPPVLELRYAERLAPALALHSCSVLPLTLAPLGHLHFHRAEWHCHIDLLANSSPPFTARCLKRIRFATRRAAALWVSDRAALVPHPPLHFETEERFCPRMLSIPDRLLQPH